jgi:D-sedoheptulose 7-phosphate isomerase
MPSYLREHAQELVHLLSGPRLAEFHKQVEQVIQQLKEAFEKGRIMYVAGNGGSAAEAQHLVEEFVVRYKENRPAYPAVALTADGTILTCAGNDFGYENVFKRQLEALGREGDVFVALSTSGNSPNILAACDEAHARGMTIVAFTGSKGKLKEVADYAITVDSSVNARIQEMHLHAIHLICEAFEPYERKTSA